MPRADQLTPLGICDRCRRPATHVVRDAIRCEPPGAPWAEYRPYGDDRRGCNRHPVVPRKFARDGSLIGDVTDPQGRPIMDGAL